jgi:hypothetical protein
MECSDDNALFVQNPNVVACEVENGQALLDLVKSEYYNLNNTAALIWQWLENPTSIEVLSQNLMAKFDVTEEQCRSDICSIMCSFEAANLVKRNNEISA